MMADALWRHPANKTVVSEELGLNVDVHEIICRGVSWLVGAPSFLFFKCNILPKIFVSL